MGDTVRFEACCIGYLLQYQCHVTAFGVENSVSLTDKSADQVLASLEKMVTDPER